MAKAFGFTSLTGGGHGALDAIDGSDLTGDDLAFGTDGTNLRAYTLNASSGATEDSPNVITPDANASDKRWILLNSPVVGNSIPTYLQYKDYSITTASNSTAIDTTHETFADFLAGDEFDDAGWLKVVLIGTITGNNGNKTFNVKLDGDTVSTITLPSDRYGEFVVELYMSSVSHTVQKFWATALLNNAASVANVGAGTVDLDYSAAVDLTITSLLTHADDEITINYIEVWRGEA